MSSNGLQPAHFFIRTRHADLKDIKLFAEHIRITWHKKQPSVRRSTAVRPPSISSAVSAERHSPKADNNISRGSDHPSIARKARELSRRVSAAAQGRVETDGRASRSPLCIDRRWAVDEVSFDAIRLERVAIWHRICWTQRPSFGTIGRSATRTGRGRTLRVRQGYRTRDRRSATDANRPGGRPQAGHAQMKNVAAFHAVLRYTTIIETDRPTDPRPTALVRLRHIRPLGRVAVLMAAVRRSWSARTPATTELDLREEQVGWQLIRWRRSQLSYLSNLIVNTIGPSEGYIQHYIVREHLGRTEVDLLLLLLLLRQVNKFVISAGNQHSDCSRANDVSA